MLSGGSFGGWDQPLRLRDGVDGAGWQKLMAGSKRKKRDGHNRKMDRRAARARPDVVSVPPQSCSFSFFVPVLETSRKKRTGTKKENEHDCGGTGTIFGGVTPVPWLARRTGRVVRAGACARACFAPAGGSDGGGGGGGVAGWLET
jgi:hypothetical protein